MVHKKSIITLMLVSLLVFSMTGCCQSITLLNEEEARKMSTVPAAWLVYWDMEAGLKDAKKVNGKLDDLVFFAANFDAEGNLVCNKELLTAHKQLKKNKYNQFLSIVNDVTNGDETVALKDPQTVLTILQDEAIQQKHIAALLELVKQGGFNGLEIDYENNLVQLCEEINSGTYQIGRSIAFIVDKPVKREIFAADFRDRVIHHFIFTNNENLS